MIEIKLEKLTATFEKRYYEKYDHFTIGELEFMCSNKGTFDENGKWIIDVLPMPYQTKLYLDAYTKGLPSKYKSDIP